MYHSHCPICGYAELSSLLSAKDYTVSKENFEIVFCENCQTGITQNVKIDEIGKYYESTDYVSHSDTRQGLINQLYHFARKMMLGQKTALLNRLNGGKRGKLLDIGTGTGYFLNEMKQKKWEVLGIEADRKTRHFAIQTFDLQVFSPEKLFDNSLSAFDVISLWHVLEHVAELKKYLAQIKQLLKPDGHLIIAVPNHWASEQNHYKQDWAAWDVPRHLWHFSPLSIQTLCDSFDFQIVEKKLMPFDPFYISMLSAKYQGKSFAFVRGMWRGLLSFLASLQDTNKASSIIYVIRHKE